MGIFEADQPMTLKDRMEALIIQSYDLAEKNHEQYLGFLKCLRTLAKTNMTLRKVMKSEGLY